MNSAWTVVKIFFLMTFLSVAQADIEQATKSYIKTGQQIIDRVNAGNIEVSAIEADVLTLTQSSVALAQAYMKKFPEGSKLIKTVIDQVAKLDASGKVVGLGPMQSLSFDVIEKQWHDLGHFSAPGSAGVDISDEDNEHFTDPLHVMIHPIMVLRAANDFVANKDPNAKDAMKAEMQEGMEQIEITASVFK